MAALPFSPLEFFKVRAPEIISVVNKKSPSVALEMDSPLPNVASLPVIVRSPVIVALPLTVALPLVVIAPPSAMVMAKTPSV